MHKTQVNSIFEALKQPKKIMHLSRLLSKHFSIKKSSLNTLLAIMKAFLLNRGVHYNQMAEMAKGKIKLNSKIKNIYRLLASDSLSEESFTNFIKGLLPQGKFILSMDRTNWQYGKIDRNIFAISICLGGVSMPIFFDVLPHKGASCANFQIKMVEEFINRFGKDRIEAIVADREFDSEKFLKYLYLNDIKGLENIIKFNIKMVGI